MRIDLHEIIQMPGRQVEFDGSPDLSDLSYGSVVGVRPDARVAGRIRNEAGVLTLTARITADLDCVCARCLCEFTHHLDMETEATLVDETDAEEDTEVFFLDGNYADVDEIVYTTILLDLDQRMLCREDCTGLCDRCGANLNDGPCSCKAEIDPRMAVLGQLLEND